MPLSKDVIGDAGEMTASIRLMESGLFRVFLLGGKVPAFDLLVEIIPQNQIEKPYQFLVQVKSTNMKPARTKKNRLKTPVPKANLSDLIDRPLPSYIAGVDISKSEVVLVSAFDKTAKYSSSIPTSYLLQQGNTNNLIVLQQLKDDIVSYWTGLNIDNYKPNYASSL